MQKLRFPPELTDMHWPRNCGAPTKVVDRQWQPRRGALERVGKGFFARKAGQKRPISLDSFQGLQEHVQEPDAPMSGR